jgi:hypothetical protein
VKPGPLVHGTDEGADAQWRDLAQHMLAEHSRLLAEVIARCAESPRGVSLGGYRAAERRQVLRVIAPAAQLVNTRSQPWPSQAREALLQSTLQAWREEGASEEEVQSGARCLALDSRPWMPPGPRLNFFAR